MLDWKAAHPRGRPGLPAVDRGACRTARATRVVPPALTRSA